MTTNSRYTVYTKRFHAGNLMNKLDKMRRRQCICDFTVKVGDRVFAAHRAVLAACSDFFEAMFSNDTIETKEGSVELKDLDPVAVEKCLGFMYTGDILLELNEAARILKVADFLQFHEMKNRCIEYFETNLSVENCLEVKVISEIFNLSQTALLADQYAIENFDRVVLTEDFTKLTVTELVDFMMKAREETKVLWHAALCWMKNASKNDDYNWGEILEVLHLQYCTFEFLFNDIWKNSIIENSDTCKQFVTPILLGSLKSSDIKSNNCFELLKLVKTQKAESQKDHIEWIYFFMGENLESVDEQTKFKTLDLEDIIQILENHHGDINMAWRATTTWVGHRPKKRIKSLPQLLEKLNLKRFSFDFLFNTMQHDPVVKRSDLCVDLVNTALLSVADYKNIDLNNWFTLLSLCKNYEKPEKVLLLKNSIITFILTNFKEICSDDNFLSFNYKFFYPVLELQTSTSGEEEKWFAVLRWVKRDIKGRQQYTSNLLKLVKLKRIPKDFIENKIYAETIVRESEECKSLIIEALFAKDSNQDKFQPTYHYYQPTNCYNKVTSKYPTRVTTAATSPFEPRSFTMPYNLPTSSKRYAPPQPPVSNRSYMTGLDGESTSPHRTISHSPSNSYAEYTKQWSLSPSTATMKNVKRPEGATYATETHQQETPSKLQTEQQKVHCTIRK